MCPESWVALAVEEP